MNKLSLLILILLLANNCSINKKYSFLGKDKLNIEEINKVKKILTRNVREEKEFNSTLVIKVLDDKFIKSFDNGQNNIGQQSYEGNLERIGKYSFSKFDDFEYIDVSPIFYKEYVIFSDNKGAIIFYDQNQKVIWKKNFYNKNEKKLRPRLNLATKKNILVVTDDVNKYYAINIETGNIIWSKNNIVPFNSDIKIRNNVFYVVDYKNTLRSISIKDGSELWNLKTEESLTKSNTKISIVIDKKNIYFNNSVGDITAADLRSGQLVWQLPTQSNIISKNAFQLSSSDLVINEKTIFLSNNKNEFYSIDTETGLVNWKNEIDSILRPIIIGEYLITVSNKGYLYIVDKNLGNIIRINNLYGLYKISKIKNIKPTGFLIAKNKVYITNSNGKLIIAKLNFFEIINTMKISGGKILRPNVYNDNLFLIRNGSIIRFD